MSKALVIKSADFSANSIEQIVVEEPVLCTGIILNKNALTVNEICATETLIATVTPSDCTQPVVWSTSNADVATVNRGTVSIAGVGTATITATCGNYSATCDVTVDNVVVDSGFTFAFVANDNGKNYAYFSAPYYKRITYADRVPTDSPRLRLSINSVSTDYYLAPHVFPKGTKKINVKSKGLNNSYSCYVFFFNSQESATAARCALMVEKDTQNASGNAIDYTVIVPDGADSYVAMVYTSATYAETDDVDAVAQNIEFEIKYMAE